MVDAREAGGLDEKCEVCNTEDHGTDNFMVPVGNGDPNIKRSLDYLTPAVVMICEGVLRRIRWRLTMVQGRDLSRLHRCCGH